MQGVFEKVETFQTEKMRNPGYNVWISGKKYGAGFNNKLFKDLAPGTTVEFTSSKNAGGYLQLDSIVPSTAVPPIMGSTPTQGVTPVYPGGREEIQMEIIRQTALKIAAEIVNGHADRLAKVKPTLPKLVENTVAFADHFVQYIKTGKVEVLSEDVVEKLKEAVEVTE